MLVPETVLYTLRVVGGHRGRRLQGGRYGLGADPGLRHGDGGPRAAGAQRISGRRKPHPDGQAEWTPQALGHRASHTRRDWPSPRPQGSRRGRKVARPDTILGWYRKLVARKFDGSKARRGPGRPRIRREVEQRIVRMAEENRSWGYDRIAGALTNLGYKVCDQNDRQCPTTPRSTAGT